MRWNPATNIGFRSRIGNSQKVGSPNLDQTTSTSLGGRVVSMFLDKLGKFDICAGRKILDRLAGKLQGIGSVFCHDIRSLGNIHLAVDPSSFYFVGHNLKDLFLGGCIHFEFINPLAKVQMTVVTLKGSRLTATVDSFPSLGSDLIVDLSDTIIVLQCLVVIVTGRDNALGNLHVQVFWCRIKAFTARIGFADNQKGLWDQKSHMRIFIDKHGLNRRKIFQGLKQNFTWRIVSHIWLGVTNGRSITNLNG
mmetsp:Transcript_42352/g.102354  ORF Transcript_42352/g.102354 Transcript_42352/m.102354 type:complete len:250 (-) Transcript_42352:1473-2222(-)